MASADTFDWSLIDREHPAPGDPVYLQGKASAYSAVHNEAGTIQAALIEISRTGDIWQGDAAAAFAAYLNELIEQLDKLKASFWTAAGAVALYATRLEGARTTADEAATKAELALQDRVAAEQLMKRAKSAKEAASKELNSAGDAVTDAQRDSVNTCIDGNSHAVADAAVRAAQQRRDSAADDLSAAQSDLSNAEGSIDEADARIEAARQLADQAKEVRESAAATCRASLEKAHDQGIKNRSNARRLWDATAGDQIAMLNDAYEYVTDVENLKSFSSVLDKIGTALGIAEMFLFWVPGLGQALAIASLAVAGTKFLVDGYLVLKGEMSWQQLAVDGVGLVFAAAGAKPAFGSIRGTVKGSAALEGGAAAGFAIGGGEAAGAVVVGAGAKGSLNVAGNGIEFSARMSGEVAAGGAVSFGPSGVKAMVGGVAKGDIDIALKVNPKVLADTILTEGSQEFAEFFLEEHVAPAVFEPDAANRDVECENLVEALR